MLTILSKDFVTCCTIFIYTVLSFSLATTNSTTLPTKSPIYLLSPFLSLSSPSVSPPSHFSNMVGCTKRLQKRKVEWLRSLLRVKFFTICDDHKDLRKNEKNLFCIDCNMCFCKHCVCTSSHCSSFHRRLQICRYVYHDVVRLQEIQKFFDCSKIQTYKINGEMAIHLNPRPQLKDVKAAKLRNGAQCQGCGRHIHDFPNQFCSIACKVNILNRMSEGEEHDMISIPLDEFDAVSWKDNYDQSEYRDDNESSLSPTDQSSEVIQCSWLSSASKPKKLVHKRKGVPRRAPLS